MVLFRLNCYCAPSVNKGEGITRKICDSAALWLPSQLVLLDGWQGDGGLKKGGKHMYSLSTPYAPTKTDRWTERWRRARGCEKSEL